MGKLETRKSVLLKKNQNKVKYCPLKARGLEL